MSLYRTSALTFIGWHAYFNSQAIPDDTTKLVVTAATAISTYIIADVVSDVVGDITGLTESVNESADGSPVTGLSFDPSFFTAGNAVKYFITFGVAYGCAYAAYSPIHNKLTEMALENIANEKAAHTAVAPGDKPALPVLRPASAPAASAP